MKDSLHKAEIDLIEIALKLYIEIHGAAAYSELVALFDTNAAAAETLLAEFTQQHQDEIKARFTASLST